ncbi:MULTISPECIES: hypothetical protein [Bacteroidota]|uniref:hypothetical protein n=1 Tax=Flavobacterium sp. TaxID=239 RepID=UPI00404744C8
MRTFGLILTLTLLLNSSCSEDEQPNWSIDKAKINKLLNSSTEQVTIEGTTLELHAYLWRDFMPISPPDGKNLISINWLVDVDSIAIPTNILLSEQYVINGDSLWSTSYTNEIRETQPYLVERVSRDGPKWGPNIEVTVIAKVIDTNTKLEHFLIRENQQILRTD